MASQDVQNIHGRDSQDSQDSRKSCDTCDQCLNYGNNSHRFKCTDCNEYKLCSKCRECTKCIKCDRDVFIEDDVYHEMLRARVPKMVSLKQMGEVYLKQLKRLSQKPYDMSEIMTVDSLLDRLYFMTGYSRIQYSKQPSFYKPASRKIFIQSVDDLIAQCEKRFPKPAEPEPEPLIVMSGIIKQHKDALESFSSKLDALKKTIPVLVQKIIPCLEKYQNFWKSVVDDEPKFVTRQQQQITINYLVFWHKEIEKKIATLERLANI